MPGIKIDILGDKELNAKLSRLPEEVADICIGEVQDYLLNVMQNDQPTPHYVSREAAYPNFKVTLPNGRVVKGFKSLKQYYYVLHLYAIGATPYHRTQALSKAWHIVKRGLFGYIANYAQDAVYVFGERKQSRHEAMVGWKKASQQIKERRDKINKIIDGAAKKAIRKLGL